MNLVDALRYFHISAGITALLTFLLPMFLAKGGKAHKRVGWIFVFAMTALCVSAGPLSIYRLFTETSRGVRIGSAFLFYISILSFAAVWHGVRVLRFKGLGANNNRLDLGVSGLLAFAGVVTAVLGLSLQTPLLVIFGAFGVYAGLRQIREWLNPNKEKMHWWFSHMGGMMGASTAALTAFLVINSTRLGLQAFSLTVWLLPTAILTPITIIWTRYYRNKFGLARAKPPVAALPTPVRVN